MQLVFCSSRNLSFTSSPKAVYNSGHDVVTLTEPGFNYFISSNHAQCASGQRIDVLVIHDPSRSVPPPPPSKILPFGKIYKVGDSKGWSGVYDSDYLNKWSEEKQFHVGDSLFFQYATDEANQVLEISGHLEFESCDPTSPVAVHKTGHDLIRLTKPGVHYFISSDSGQCEAGLKLRVVVGPLPKVVTPPNVHKKMDFSLKDHFKRWLGTFRYHHHH
ncbi:unnamed protein product [Arabis nemorensis]|uniref:Phytocyanin domain-containing protein n=1 Tax=Arabis nemorensis TaxID=586526 RepID=A0A565C5K3_9BRAS|nr:unnamed protein product [Arabis nemorensis]